MSWGFQPLLVAAAVLSGAGSPVSTTLSGLDITSAQGNFTPEAIVYSSPGQSAPLSQGTVRYTVAETLAAQTVTTTAGALPARTQTESIDGGTQLVTSAQGNVSLAYGRSIANQTITSATGGPLESVVEGLNNLFIGANQGTPTTQWSGNVSIATQLITSAQGTPVDAVAPRLASQTVNVIQGETVKGGVAYLTTQLITSAQGSLDARERTDESIATQLITSATGTVTAQWSGNVSIATQLVASAQGSLDARESIGTQLVTLAIGTVAPAISDTVASQTISSATGTVTTSIVESITAQLVTSAQGTPQEAIAESISAQTIATATTGPLEEIVEGLNNLFFGFTQGQIVPAVDETPEVYADAMQSAIGQIDYGVDVTPPTQTIDGQLGVVTFDLTTSIASEQQISTAQAQTVVPIISKEIYDQTATFAYPQTLGAEWSGEGLDNLYVGINQGELGTIAIVEKLLPLEMSVAQGEITKDSFEVLESQAVVADQGNVAVFQTTDIGTQSTQLSRGDVTISQSVTLQPQTIAVGTQLVLERVVESLDNLYIGANQGSIAVSVVEQVSTQSIGSVQGGANTTISTSIVGRSITVVQGDLAERADEALESQLIVGQQGSIAPASVTASPIRADVAVDISGQQIGVAELFGPATTTVVRLPGRPITFTIGDLPDQVRSLASLVINTQIGNVVGEIGQLYDIEFAAVTFDPVISTHDEYAINMISGSVESAKTVDANSYAINMIDGDPDSTNLIEAKVHTYV